MTYIEFYDKTSSENICACLANIPDRVMLIGDSAKTMQRSADRYRSIFADRGHDVEFICRSINKNSLGDIVEALTDIVHSYNDCVFDLTGGEELYLVAMGIVKERYPDKDIQMSRFNIKNNTLFDCDEDGKTIMKNIIPEMSVEENVRVYGGDVVHEHEKAGRTVDWDLDDDFRSDIAAMWEICREDVKQWNIQISVFDAVMKFNLNDSDSAAVIASEDDIIPYLSSKGIKLPMNKSFISKLYKSGLILAYDNSDGFLCVEFKNEQVKRCLTKAGQALEMKIFVAAVDATEDAIPVYNDVRTGVCIDWDGEIHFGEDIIKDTENEIDIIMMHRIVPVFVSCKNGNIDMDELYKLNSVADRFGSKYSKKVLVATALENMGSFAVYFRQRAKDMNITLIENIQNMTDAELSKKIKNLWNS